MKQYMPKIIYLAAPKRPSGQYVGLCHLRWQRGAGTQLLAYMQAHGVSIKVLRTCSVC
jgi:hypothetical protein